MQLVYHSERDFNLSCVAENFSVYLHKLLLSYLESRYPFIPFASLLALFFFDLEWSESFQHFFFSDFDHHPFVFSIYSKILFLLASPVFQVFSKISTFGYIIHIIIPLQCFTNADWLKRSQHTQCWTLFCC